MHASSLGFILYFVLVVVATPSPSGYKRAPHPEPSARSFSKRTYPAFTLEKVNTPDFSAELCPDALRACPIINILGAPSTTSVPKTLREWTTQGWECIDVKSDVYSCGGCAALDSDRDCTNIPHSLAVSCDASVCEVHSCRKGYAPSVDKSTCERA